MSILGKAIFFLCLFFALKIVHPKENSYMHFKNMISVIGVSDDLKLDYWRHMSIFQATAVILYCDEIYLTIIIPCEPCQRLNGKPISVETV